MSTIFALLSLLIAFGMVAAVIYHAEKIEREYAAVFSECFKEIATELSDNTVVNITMDGINK